MESTLGAVFSSLESRQFSGSDTCVEALAENNVPMDKFCDGYRQRRGLRSITTSMPSTENSLCDSNHHPTVVGSLTVQTVTNTDDSATIPDGAFVSEQIRTIGCNGFPPDEKRHLKDKIGALQRSKDDQMHRTHDRKIAKKQKSRKKSGRHNRRDGKRNGESKENEMTACTTTTTGQTPTDMFSIHVVISDKDEFRLEEGSSSHQLKIDTNKELFRRSLQTVPQLYQKNKEDIRFLRNWIMAPVPTTQDVYMVRSHQSQSQSARTDGFLITNDGIQQRGYMEVDVRNVDGCQSAYPVRNPMYTDESAREGTYQYWTKSDPGVFSMTGFFYTGDKDIVRCFHCDIGIAGWNPTNDPWIEHARMSPDCPILRNKKSQEWIDNIRAQWEQTYTPNYPEYQQMDARLRSFENDDWRRDNVSRSPDHLADAGFFFADDRVRCHYCDGTRRENAYTDEPWLEHAQTFPCCKFVLRSKGIDFIKTHNGYNPGNERPGHYLPMAAGPKGHGVTDTVRCHYCDGGLHEWEPNDDPWTEHARWFPFCNFVIKFKGLSFIQAAARPEDSDRELDNPTGVSSPPTRERLSRKSSCIHKKGLLCNSRIMTGPDLINKTQKKIDLQYLNNCLDNVKMKGTTGYDTITRMLLPRYIDEEHRNHSVYIVKDVKSRISTYSSWHSRTILPGPLVEGGFTCKDARTTTVECTACRLVLDASKLNGKSPLDYHREHSPDCEFFHQTNSRNTDGDLTRALTDLPDPLVAERPRTREVFDRAALTVANNNNLTSSAEDLRENEHTLTGAVGGDVPYPIRNPRYTEPNARRETYTHRAAHGILVNGDPFYTEAPSYIGNNQGANASPASPSPGHNYRTTDAPGRAQTGNIREAKDKPARTPPGHNNGAASSEPLVAERPRTREVFDRAALTVPNINNVTSSGEVLRDNGNPIAGAVGGDVPYPIRNPRYTEQNARRETYTHCPHRAAHDIDILVNAGAEDIVPADTVLDNVDVIPSIGHTIPWTDDAEEINLRDHLKIEDIP